MQGPVEYLLEDEEVPRLSTKLGRENNLSPAAEAENISISGFHLKTLCPLPQLLGSSVLADEYSRPVVMSQSALSSGQYSNKATSIKEILVSVLESYDGFKPSTEECTPGTRLSSQTSLQSTSAKKLWHSWSRDGEQRQSVGIPMTTSKDYSCSNNSLSASPELTSSHVISNAFNKLLLSVQSTAANCTVFTDGSPSMVALGNRPPHGSNYPDKARNCQRNRPETIMYTSYLSNPSFSASKAQERENTYFIVADLVIATLENVKCNILYQQAKLGEEDNSNVIKTSVLRTCIKKESHSDSVNSVDSGFECSSATRLDDSSEADSKDSQNGDDAVGADDDDYDDFVIIEFDDLVIGSDGPLKSERHCLSAEYLARRLFKSFRTVWLPQETDRHQFEAVGMVLHKFLPLKDTLPGAEESVDLTADFKVSSRLRGTADWAPPRFQILFFIHPPQKREVVVAAQNFLCAGCGTRIESKYIKKLHYCEYLGKYFCECCHHSEESMIPGRILMKWDFSKHPVSHFSKQLLENIWHDPLFNILYINNSLYSKVKELSKVKALREQLIRINTLLRNCRLAKSAMVEFWQLKSHLSEELHLYSLNDLVMVKRGLLVPGLKDILRIVLSHVESCEICMAKGFICEFCKSREILFPFQAERCKRCCVCKACFHKECFTTEQCPKCTRINARKELLALQQTTD
ncbi:protein associated with UVRAG as autophagy enhancer isoform X2 [Mobula birostris]|uniref:protein associated with UVRAG as autophagy enhancer isoform X2 n=1 Tax=Mobula birostris TaxID=1983395 RepID=UPI003B27F450